MNQAKKWWGLASVVLALATVACGVAGERSEEAQSSSESAVRLAFGSKPCRSMKRWGEFVRPRDGKPFREKCTRCGPPVGRPGDSDPNAPVPGTTPVYFRCASAVTRAERDCGGFQPAFLAWEKTEHPDPVQQLYVGNDAHSSRSGRVDIARELRPAHGSYVVSGAALVKTNAEGAIVEFADASQYHVTTATSAQHNGAAEIYLEFLLARSFPESPELAFDPGCPIH